jgi:chromosome segregation ATPase
MNRYEKLSKQISKIESEIEETRQALTETQGRVDSAQGRLDVLWESLKVKLMQEDKANIKGVEKAIDETKTEATRDEALAEGLEERLTLLEQKREGLIQERNEVIVNSGDKWLAKEIETYEAIRENLLRCVRRLSASSTILHECGDGGREIARARLGEVWEYLRTLKVPSIKAFSAGMYADDRPNPDLATKPNERQEVKNELTK